jgi:endoglucanase Acf2
MNQEGQMKQQGPMNQEGQMKQQGPMNQEGIYGGELMSEQERNQYREQLRLTDSNPEQQTRFKAEHQEKMQKRAQEKGVKLPDPPADESGD